MTPQIDKEFKGHLIFSGSTYSGKTFLAKAIAGEVYPTLSKNEKIFVLDKYSNGSDWACDFHTRDAREFIEMCKANTSVHMIVDEGGSSLKKFEAEFDWLGTESRHNGNKLWLITQRAQQIAPTIREQCKQIFLFNIAPKGADTWADEMIEPDLKKARYLPQYEFLFKERFGPCIRGKLDVA